MLKLTQAILNKLKTDNKSVVIWHKYFKSTVAETKSLEEPDRPNKNPKPVNNMVAAAFASLKPGFEISTPVTDEKIKKAASVNDLLSISEGSGISRRHALKVVSTLAEWSSSGKTKVSEFENDARFIKLCRILSKGAKINRNVASRSEDLSTILAVTADDEAARLISGLNLSQMVKVMTTLSLKKRRSVMLLRTLAYNITASNEQLNLKESADLLYSMCFLSFIDENLIAKICGDVTTEIRKDIEKSAVVGSIITSLGLLKYKNCEILDVLSEWILNNNAICRSQDVFSLFITLASVNYIPINSEELFKVFLPQLSMSDARKPAEWLDFVWSLVVLDAASADHISSVLSQNFIDKFDANSSCNIPVKIKLLNVNGAAKLMKNYNGEVLPLQSPIYDFRIVKTKEKSVVIETVVDALKNLIPTENHLRLNTNTGLGCSVDIECWLDRKCNSLPLDDDPKNGRDCTRVAILVYDYHDMCIGKIEPSGVNVLASRLLQSQNYKILQVPYNEFRVTDKLVHRVQYLESRLKSLVK